MKLTELIKDANHVVAFVDAGLSTESGIPDFRSTGGLYLSGDYESHTPESIISRRFFRTNPALFTAFYQTRILSMRDKKPNRGHFAMKALQDMGKLNSVVSQNIDNLLQTAGVTKVLDLHGNITSYRCVSCQREYTQNQYAEFTGIPRCGCGGIVRPNTVLFDEWLDDTTFDLAYKEISTADLVIVIGSSLIVQPACTLLDEIKKDAQFVIINRDVTPYDGRANLILREPCGEVLESVVKELAEG